MIQLGVKRTIMKHSETAKPYSIILGVIGSDCHSVGNKILEKFLTSKNFNVTNLGVMVSQKEFVDAAIETAADAILVSSLYGHGEIDCSGLRDVCIERGIEDIILYAGGNLVIGKHSKEETVEKFLNMGYNRVFHSNCDLDEMAKLLASDIKKRRDSMIK